MKNNIIILIFLLAIGFNPSFFHAQEKPEEKLGWKLGSQAYTFKEFTFFEAVEKIEDIGLSYVEAYPGQEIGGGIEGVMEFPMDREKRVKILNKLEKADIKMLSFGVVSIDNEADWNKLFDFAKAMDIKNITAEPRHEDIPFIAELAEKNKIKVAIHNHPKPTRYWHPDTVLDAIRGQNQWVGACADIGHWVRSGLDPVECLKKLEGHIMQLHFKDLNKREPEAHDVPWGQGVSNVEGVLKELHRQNFKGLFSVEYEHNWHNNVPEIKKSVDYFRTIATILANERQ